MSVTHDSMMSPPIEDLLDKIDSKFGLVTLAARRGRSINQYFAQLGEGQRNMIPPQVSTTARKPLSIAFEEIAQAKIVWAEPVEEVETSALLDLGDGAVESDADDSA